jgi:hypothetical protein
MGEEDHDPGMSYVGVELFFASLEMAARAQHIVDHGTDDGYIDLPSESHPSNSKRLEVLRDALAMFVPQGAALERMHSVATDYRAISAALWERVKVSQVGAT